mmetsp:Transcript_35652/g.93194  ORF Transcript_35652/g.93194 Transcript_35652/m.93194 type:complete len:208 (-) Transcript_35652:116-739(-)
MHPVCPPRSAWRCGRSEGHCADSARCDRTATHCQDHRLCGNDAGRPVVSVGTLLCDGTGRPRGGGNAPRCSELRQCHVCDCAGRSCRPCCWSKRGRGRRGSASASASASPRRPRACDATAGDRARNLRQHPRYHRESERRETRWCHRHLEVPGAPVADDQGLCPLRTGRNIRHLAGVGLSLRAWAAARDLEPVESVWPILVRLTATG